jgi:hypothetical protein
MNQNISPSWKKNPMVWMVIFFPSLAIVAGVITIIIAVKTDDGLVVDDYYKKGIEINQSLERDKIANEKGIKGLLSLNSDDSRVQIKFDDQIASNIQGNVSFKLLHRTISGLDQHIDLNKGHDTALYTGVFAPLPENPGRWPFEISADDWRVSGQLTTQGNETVLLSFPK